MIGQDDGGKLRFYPIGASQNNIASNSSFGMQENAPAPNLNQVIEGEFRDVTKPAAGRSLVPVEQPFDSRTAAALRQHALARARHQRQGRVSLPAQYATVLNSLFDLDSDGTETWGALQQAQIDRLKAATLHEQWMREKRSRQVAEAEQRKELEKKKRQDEEVSASIRRLLHPEEEETPRRCGSSRKLRTLDYEEDPEPAIPIPARETRQATLHGLPRLLLGTYLLQIG